MRDKKQNNNSGLPGQITSIHNYESFGRFVVDQLVNQSGARESVSLTFEVQENIAKGSFCVCLNGTCVCIIK